MKINIYDSAWIQWINNQPLYIQALIGIPISLIMFYLFMKTFERFRIGAVYPK